MLDTSTQFKTLVKELLNIMSKVKTVVVKRANVKLNEYIKVINGVTYTVAILTKPKKEKRNIIKYMQLTLF